MAIQITCSNICQEKLVKKLPNKKCLISTTLNELMPNAPHTSNYINRLYNKRVMRNGKNVGKIINIEPKGEDNWLILMEVEEDSVNDPKENEKASFESGYKQECSGPNESDVKEN